MAGQFYLALKPKAERLAASKFFDYVVDNYDPLTSYFSDNIKSLPSSGYYTVQGTEGRPDNISWQLYGDTQYWWILCMYNGLTEFDQFNTGDIVNFPSIDSIEDLFFSLKAKQSASGS